MDDLIVIAGCQVQCDETTNPPEIFEANELRAKITLKTIRINVEDIIEELREHLDLNGIA